MVNFIIGAILFIACRENEIDTIATLPLPLYSGTMKIQLIPESIECVFSQEGGILNYFNVIKTDEKWIMWYYFFPEGNKDYNGILYTAYSEDGKNWKKSDIEKDTLLDQDNYAIAGAYVYKDSLNLIYKMICTRRQDQESTHLYSSIDGIHWKWEKQLFPQMQDSQFSVIEQQGLFYIFHRYNYNYGQSNFQRAIGISTMNKSNNIVQESQLIVKTDFKEKYNHIYNNAASKVDDNNILLFPTYYDAVNDVVCIKILHLDGDMENISLVNDNINFLLFPNTDIKWSVVSPGLIPSDEKNIYWLYYMGYDGYSHNDGPKNNIIPAEYFRIKVKIER